MLRHFPKFIFVSAALFTVSFAQDSSHERTIREYSTLHSRLRDMEKTILGPTDAEVRAAAEQGLKAIRLMPREKYEHSLTIRGGGAYYSFTRLTHEYNYGSDIQLEQNSLSVGFAGADYGFLYDLGEVDLAQVDKNSGPIQFLVKYQPPTDESSIRAEQRRSHEYETSGYVYKSRVPATVGHTYILRSIGFSTADVLVALNIVRKDADGSLIIFWRPIETFKKPEIARNAGINVP